MKHNAAFLPLGAAALTAPTRASIQRGTEHVFIQGGPLVGGTNGMMFDSDNNLIVARVVGRAISTLNAETGQIIESLGFEDSVGFPDDVAVASDGTLYWSDYFYYKTIFSRKPGGPSVPLLPPGSVPFANPVTLSTDETRLFYGQCWNPEPVNGVYEYNLMTNTTTRLLSDIPGCASNAMDFVNETLYMPRPFEGRIVKLDLANNNTVSNVTTGWGGAPNSLKFDSQGRLYATNTGNGEIAMVDTTNPDTENNRQIVAQTPPGSIDNLALDKDDRLYLSSASDSAVFEVLTNGDLRTVVPGQFSIPMGLAILNNTLFVVHSGALFGFDSVTGERVIETRSSPGGAGSLYEPTSLATWSDALVLLSFITGALQIYDPFSATVKATTFFSGPIDAHPFNGGLVVTDFANGTVVLASGDDFSERQVILSSAGVAFLAGDDDNVYLTDLVDQALYQIILDGNILDPPIIIASGFLGPEGIALLPGGDKILLVDAGKESLEEVDIATGEVKTIAVDLGFLPGIPGIEIGFGNDVKVDEDGAIYVNGDRTNVIYKFSGSSDDIPTSAAVPTTLWSFQYVISTLTFLFFLVY
jgi:sugar lactone lactonase YvrE